MKGSDLAQDTPLAFCRGHRAEKIEPESSDDDHVTPRTVNRDTLLMRAASDGDADRLRSILDIHSELLGQKNRPGKTALMLAAERGHYECARELLQEVGITTPSGTTALMLAIRARHTPIIELLAPLEGTLSGMTALMQTIITGSVSTSTIATYSTDLGQQDRCGMSALMYSVLFCRPESTALILQSSVSSKVSELSLISDKQETALMIATEQDCPECVTQLLAEAGHISRGRRSALLIAMELPRRDCADLLLSSEKERMISGVTQLMVDARYGASTSDSLLRDSGKSAVDRKTALMHASIAGNLEMVQALKQKEARMQDKLGWTALMYAVRSKNTGIVSKLALCEAGVISRSGETALSIAIEQEFEPAVQILLPHEMSVTTEYCPNLVMHSVRRRPPNIPIISILIEYYIKHSSKRPFVPLHRPAEGFWKETALIRAAAVGDKALIEKNLTQVGQMHRGYTALLMAAERNRADCIPLLLRELGIQVWDGQTALMRASELGHVECIPLLLAESYVTTAAGTTALMRASAANKPDAVRLLLHEAGLQDAEGHTALMVAAQRNHQEVVEILVDLEKGIMDKEAKTALMHAILNKATDCIEPLLRSEREFTKISPLMVDVSLGKTISVEAYRSELRRLDNHGNTALMYAVMAKNYSGIQVLLESEGGMQSPSGAFGLLLAAELQDLRGIELIAQCPKERSLYDARGDTALTYSIKRKLKGSTQALAKLLFDVPTSNGTLPLDIALTEGNGEAYALLYSLHLEKSTEFILTQKPLVLKRVEEPTELLRAVDRKDIEGVRAHLNRVGYMLQGRSALFKAAEAGSVDILRLLLCESRNTNLIGETALILATLSGNREAVQILAPLETGISGFNEAMVCAALDDLPGLKKCIDEGSCMADTLGNTALVYAAACGSLLCMEYLLKQGIGKESGKLTPLMAAARNNKVDAVRLLLECSQFHGQQDVLGMTALMHAVDKRACEAACLLLPHEATLINAFGETAFDIARRRNVSLSE
ncbi:Ankyrin repeat protein [Giardia duodenalis]|uniref:Ankyrin repeat protein n=1 Tax=Giardia intestinalis TaxID=5741 RepID=V6TGB9_GIAIN|nr:Ankyrin repeat protein [Giardia intestinalis]